MAALFTSSKFSATDASGTPLAGGKVWTYSAGTLTPKATFTTQAGNVSNANPVILDSTGRADIWLGSGAYKFVVTDSADVAAPDGTVDNITAPSLEIAADLASASDADLGAGMIGYSGSLAYAAGTVGKKLIEWVSPDDFGAVGDGATVDTTAFQAALTSGLNVRGRPGATYLISPTSQSTARQVIDMGGCTVKRISASAHDAMLTCNGAGVRVIGGTWDGNKAAQSGTLGDRYTHTCITFLGDYSEVLGVTTVDAWGIGIKGAACSYTKVSGTVNRDFGLFGIYVESTTTDEAGNVIDGNLCASTSEVDANGIYLSGSNAPFTYKQRSWQVTDNICQGATSGSVTGIGITTRGVDGLIANNQTTGFTMGISADLASGTPITGNRCVDMAGASAYGIELNNSKCVVTGNFIRGGNYGIIGSGNAAAQDYSLVANNEVDSFAMSGIYFNPSSGGFTARHLKVTGNTLIFGGSAANRTGIRLAGDCKYSDLEGNKIIGPGKSVSGCRGVYLDSAGGNVNILGGSMSGLERAVALYSASVAAYTDVRLIGVDCALDMNDDASHLSAEGSATIGARCVQRDIGKAGATPLQYDDRQNSILETWGAGSPEGAITAGIGSRYYRTDGGATTTLYIKTSGTGDTGWTAK